MRGNNNKKESQNILLVSCTSIHNQLIQREVENNSDYKLTIKGSSKIENLAFVNSFDIILIPYVLLERMSNVTSNAVCNIDLIVFDVPKELEKAQSVEIKLLSQSNLKGILYNDAPIEHIVRCIKTVSMQEFWLPRKVMHRMLANTKPHSNFLRNYPLYLTKREKQILNGLLNGYTNLQIAEELFIAESTVKTHVYKLYKKLDVNNRKEVIEKMLLYRDH